MTLITHVAFPPHLDTKRLPLPESDRVMLVMRLEALRLVVERLAAVVARAEQQGSTEVRGVYESVPVDALWTRLLEADRDVWLHEQYLQYDTRVRAVPSGG